jgi:hypothetical protein
MSMFPFDEPARPLHREDLHGREASSQAPRHGQLS